MSIRNDRLPAGKKSSPVTLTEEHWKYLKRRMVERDHKFVSRALGEILDEAMKRDKNGSH